jgi:hypothetical protein
MANPKRLVLLVEGHGDVEAAPVLLGRLLKEYHASSPVFDSLVLDKLPPLRVGEYSIIHKNDFSDWRRYLQVALKTRGNVGGCLLLLDGDCPPRNGTDFCARDAAKLLAEEAVKVGAGNLFSLGIVFACQEFES